MTHSLLDEALTFIERVKNGTVGDEIGLLEFSQLWAASIDAGYCADTQSNKYRLLLRRVGAGTLKPSRTEESFTSRGVDHSRPHQWALSAKDYAPIPDNVHAPIHFVTRGGVSHLQAEVEGTAAALWISQATAIKPIDDSTAEESSPLIAKVIGALPEFAGKLYKQIGSSSKPKTVEYMLSKTERYELEACKNPKGQGFYLAKVRSEIAARFVEEEALHSPLTRAIGSIVKSPASR